MQLKLISIRLFFIFFFLISDIFRKQIILPRISRIRMEITIFMPLPPRASYILLLN